MASKLDVEITNYEDINRRLSQDSSGKLEHARYVDRWVEEVHQLSSLANNNRPVSSLSESASQTSEWSSDPNGECLQADESPGNVIGIRGFSNSQSSNNLHATIGRERQHQRMHRGCQMKCNKYDLLKANYAQLQSDFASLRKYIDKSMTNMNTNFNAKDFELQQLRAMLKHSVNNNSGQKYDNDKDDNNDGSIEWKKERDILLAELKEIKDKLNTRDKSSNGKTVDFLRQDNDKLRAQLDRDAMEFGRLKQDYVQLESRLKSLLDEEKLVCESKEDEIAKVRLELCRLQVYQPKLEQILKGERAINGELQKQIAKLQQELAISREKNEVCQRDLNQERVRGAYLQSNETQNVVHELEKWQSKFKMLQRTLWQGEERARLLESKLEQLEKSRANELENSRERNRSEKLELIGSLNKCQLERDSMASKLANQCKENSSLRNEADSLRQKLRDSCRELELSRGLNERSGLTIERLETDSTRVYELQSKLKELELSHRQVCNDFENSKIELDSWKREMNQAKQRLLLQQRAFDDYRERKEKELARLRVSLNFEQYQRQIALENIERELKSSVRELETMKCRFSGSRNNLNHNKSSSATTTTTNATGSTTKATAFCNNYKNKDKINATNDVHADEKQCELTQSNVIAKTNQKGRNETMAYSDNQELGDDTERSRVVIRADDDPMK